MEHDEDNRDMLASRELLDRWPGVTIGTLLLIVARWL
jgi:hypothetical protein